MAEPGDLGVEEVRAAAAADHDDLVAVEAGRGEQRDLVGALEPGRSLDLEERQLRRRRGRCRAPIPRPGGPERPSRPGTPSAAGRPAGRRASCGLAVSSSTASRSRNRLPPAAYRLIQSTSTPSSALHAETIESGIGRRVSRSTSSTRGAVVALLDDLDRLDVTARLADGRGQPTQRTGHVGQLHAQQERHVPTLTPTCCRHVSGLSGAAASRCREPGRALRAGRRPRPARRPRSRPPGRRSWARVTAV